MESGDRQIHFGGRFMEEDFIAAWELIRRKNGVSTPRSVGIFFWIFAFLLGGLGAVTPSAGLLLFAGVLGVIGWFQFTHDRRAARRAKLSYETRGTFSSQGFEVHDPQASTQWKWSAIGLCFRKADLLVLATGSGILVFPRRFLASDQDWQDLQKLIETASPAPPASGLFTPLPPGTSRWRWYLKKTAWLVFWGAVIILLAYWMKD
jgi:hypothetical protein